jgi:hypothetical protein
MMLSFHAERNGALSMINRSARRSFWRLRDSRGKPLFIVEQEVCLPVFPAFPVLASGAGARALKVSIGVVNNPSPSSV